LSPPPSSFGVDLNPKLKTSGFFSQAYWSKPDFRLFPARMKNLPNFWISA